MTKRDARVIVRMRIRIEVVAIPTKQKTTVNGKTEAERIDERIVSSGGKRSRSRATVISAFLVCGRHVSAEELVTELRASGNPIGLATVYRTLKLLVGMGFAREVRLGDRFVRYESGACAHHDHLVCTGCGKIFEFENPEIERLQEKVARRHGFRPTNHRLEIYGICRTCRASATTLENGRI